MTAEHLALLRLHLTPQLGRSALFKIHERFSTFSAAVKATAADWLQAGIPQPLFDNRPDEQNKIFLKALTTMDQLGITICSFWDADYPQLLREIFDPPALLYIRGQLPKDECLAIVGSRRASAAGQVITKELAADLAGHGTCIVSGLARGIDSAAHRGALQANGRTIAVLGCGVDQVYPPENGYLYNEILRNNAIISEYPPGTRPLSGHFPGRNRIISGLSRGVLIVEAAEKSGSLITGDFALEQGRELFAMPGSIQSPNSNGTNRLLKQGAALVTESSDILNQLWPEKQLKQRAQVVDSQTEELDAVNRKVYQQLSGDPLHSDEIAHKCGLTPMELSVILLDLELRGVIQALPGDFFVRC